MKEQYERTRLLFGESAMKKLAASRVAIFGIGGVGGYVMEALARSGIGTLDLIDADRVDETNINRQILATHDTIGRYKVEVAKERVHAIDPAIRVNTHAVFYLPATAASFDFSVYDYVVDAVDTVTAKLDIIQQALAAGVPVLSSMGCGNRIDPSALAITDIYRTHNDPLAKIMRRELKKRRIRKLKVLCSEELPLQPLHEASSAETPAGGTSPDSISNGAADSASAGKTPSGEHSRRRSIPGSTAFVPPAAGLLIASEVVMDLTGFDPAPHHKGGRQQPLSR